MVHKVLFWTGFGVAVRLWQLGMEMRPFFAKSSLAAYPIFMACGAGFGFWLQGVESRQIAMLNERKERLLEKRRRRAERELQNGTGLAEETA